MSVRTDERLICAEDRCLSPWRGAHPCFSGIAGFGTCPPPPVRKISRRGVKPRLEPLEDRIVPTAWFVTSAADSGAGTLRDIVMNHAQSGDSVFFDPSIYNQGIALNSAIPISQSITIDGTNSGVTIDGQHSTRLFEIVSGNVTINGLPMNNGSNGSMGGAILVDGGAELSVANDSFSGNQAPSGGAIENLGTLDVHLGNTFTGNTASGNGGAIANMGTLNMGLNGANDGSTFKTNTATNGGAICNQGTASIQANTVIDQNTATNDGGAIENMGKLTIAIGPNAPATGGGGPVFDYNTAGVNGGAIASEDNGSGQVNVSGAEFGNNTTTSGNGGALFTADPTTLNNDMFSNDQANGSGGAVEAAIIRGLFSDTNVTYSDCIADGGDGGAIEATSRMTLTTDTFASNKALVNNGNGGNGGAIKVESGAIVNIYGGTFDSNQADTDGGAIENLGDLTIDDYEMGNYPRFTSNKAIAFNGVGGYGGAIDSGGNGLGQLEVSNSTFYSNSAKYGGAIFTNDGTTLNSCSFGRAGQPNVSMVAGGAVYANPGKLPTPALLDVNSCTFASNQAGGGGGAIQTFTNTDVELSTFTSNQATLSDGGAIDFYASNQFPAPSINFTLTLNLDTFTSNKSEKGGAVASFASVASGQVKTIVANDTFSQNNVVSQPAGTGLGGALYIGEITAGAGSGVTATLTNDTFFQNTSDSHGGALALTLRDSTGSNQYATASLTSLTVNQNTAATDSGGLYIDSSLTDVVSVDNSILDGNFVTANGYNGPVDVTMTNNNVALKDKGFNLVGTTDDTMFFVENNDFLNNTTGLANTLAANGAPQGYPQTLALSNTSPGYESGDETLAGQRDERGFYRQAGKVSISAEDPDAIVTA